MNNSFTIAARRLHTEESSSGALLEFVWWMKSIARYSMFTNHLRMENSMHILGGVHVVYVMHGMEKPIQENHFAASYLPRT